MKRHISCKVCDFFERTRLSWLSAPLWTLGFLSLLFGMFVWPVFFIVAPVFALFALVDAVRVGSCSTCRLVLSTDS